MEFAFTKTERILRDTRCCKTEYMRVKATFSKAVTKSGVTEKKLNGF